MEQNAVRNGELDFIKGILTILVTLGHCIQYGNGELFLNQGGYWENLLFKLIYSFHMPLFMLISGFLSYNSFQKYGGLDVLQKRIKQFVPPLFFWSLVRNVLYVVAQRSDASIKRIIVNMLTGLWFLLSILICTTLVVLVERLPNKFRRISYLLILVIFLFTPDILWAHAHKFMFPFFVIGYYYAKGKCKFVSWKPKFGIMMLVLWGGMLFLFNKDCYIYTTQVSILTKLKDFLWVRQVTIDIFRVLVGLTGSVASICLLVRVYGFLKNIRKIATAIEWMGKNALAIYILTAHMSGGILSSLTTALKPNYFMNVFETALILVIAVGISKCLLKTKKLGRIIL